MRILRKNALMVMITSACLLLTGCNTSVGVGLSVGVPIGSHGYMSIGTGRRGWY
jgi:predicted small secreted protein